MSRFGKCSGMLALLCLGALSSAQAAVPVAAVFHDSFEPAPIVPIFPRVGGLFQLPSNPTTDQLAWVMGEFAATETTTAAEVDAHFDARWLSQVSVAQTQQLFQAIRTQIPDAVIDEVVTLTPVRAVLVIRSPVNNALGFMQIGAAYTGAKKIVQLGNSGYGGSTQYVQDRSLTLMQAIDKFVTLSDAPAFLIARIDADGTCVPVEQRNAATLRATGSIFKLWVLTALADAIADGTLEPTDTMAMQASEIAPAGIINSEPLGTLFTLSDLAQAMIGISDNTATDMLHALAGRTRLDSAVDASGVADPNVLKPLLGISEQFHLFHSFALSVSQSYVNGTEVFQRDFLANQIEPNGPVGNGPHPYFHTSLLTSGSWRASPNDVCAVFAHLRTYDGAARDTLAYALGASAAQPGVRNRWDRVWYKGGSLLAGTNQYAVLTHAWMLERTGERPVVIVAMSNDDSGYDIDQFAVQSVTGRILELAAGLH